MCGRYTLTAEMSILAETFPLFSFSEIHSPRYNIAPTQPVLAVAVSYTHLTLTTTTYV